MSFIPWITRLFFTKPPRSFIRYLNFYETLKINKTFVVNQIKACQLHTGFISTYTLKYYDFYFSKRSFIFGAINAKSAAISLGLLTPLNSTQGYYSVRYDIRVEPAMNPNSEFE